VTGTDEDIITFTLTLQMLFLTNLTNPMCTINLGLNSWDLFTLIASQSIELITVRSLAAILVARLYRCSTEDQRVLARVLPILIVLVEKSSAPGLVDPPGAYPYHENVLSIITVWSDFSGVINKYYLAPTGPMPVCREKQQSKYNYTIPSVFTDILYTKDPRYWGHFQVDPQLFRSNEGGALLLNGDL
ncbi:unnamed protein product, partial [Rotaria sp. Silwood2]